MTDQYIVKKCLLEIFKKNGYAEVDRLTQRDFDHISQRIEDNTGTLISGITIKRLLNGEFSRLPQIATLDAISRYLGYHNWQEYKALFRDKEENQLAKEDTIDTENPVQKASSLTNKRFRLAVVMYLVIGVTAVLGFIQFSGKKPFANVNRATFSARTNTNNDIPNTVVFTYNVDEVQADSFFIQQSWDKNRRVRISKNNYTLTDIYYEPGYHIAKLIANDSVIQTIDINIPTDRWFFFAKDNPSSKPDYIYPDQIVHDGMLSIIEADLLNSHIDIHKEKEYLYTYFPGKMHVDGDNYVLKTKIRVKEVKKNSCPYLMPEIFCQRYTMFFTSTPKGCSSESMVQFGEHFISGKETDLASLGFDVTQWMDLEVRVKDKQAVIRINNKDVFATSYKTTSKLLTGIGFVSNGLCEIDFIELKGLNGDIVYTNNFDNRF
ncbi:hypothetical protein QNI19_00870 [Cytophagaceae bacterium DM2B3-1]|uniref:Uncharacterized protein n=1 Tax=Xanthocytophaga flava TaxID=3048013 RepID=A0ABT7CCQ3_9BACT|nr:hypothetical protein [Xanthocytophaga flavus]MDJ1491458.1 hypothetical protein [Xanthocytophaga flavus]